MASHSHGENHNNDLRVLVTGGAGFLGRAILRELAKAPPGRVTVFDRETLDSESSRGRLHEETPRLSCRE